MSGTLQWLVDVAYGVELSSDHDHLLTKKDLSKLSPIYDQSPSPIPDNMSSLSQKTLLCVKLSVLHFIA